MKNWPLRLQILALVLATAVLVVVALTGLMIEQMHYQLHGSLERKAVGVSSLLAENLGPGLDFGDSAFINVMAGTSFVDPDIVGIDIRDNETKSLFRSATAPGVFANTDPSLQVHKLQISHRDEFCYVTRPIQVHGRQVGHLTVALSQEAMLAQLYRSITVTVVVAIVLLILISTASTILARRLMRPIQTISEAAACISSGEMATPIDVTLIQRDFLPLGTAFNKMQTSLAHTFGELNRSRDELESQVLERTRALQEELDARKKIEGALQEGRELLRATLESTADGILVVDHRGVTTHFNRRFAEMWNIPEELLRTKEDNRLLAHVLDQLVDPQAFLDKVRRLYATTDESMDTLHFKNGRVFERFSSPLTRNGRPIGRVWNFRDVTERVQALEKLQFTQFSIDHVADAAFWMSRDARVFYVNEAACLKLGYTRQELLGMTVHDIDPNFPLEAWPMQWRQLKQKGSLNYRSTHRCKDGREYPVEITANFVEFQGQEFNCAFSRDISHLRYTEQAQSVLLKVAEAANEATNLTELLRKVHALLSGFVDATNFYVALWDAEKEIYTFPYAVDEHADEDFSPQRLERSLTDYVRRHGSPLFVDDKKHEEMSASGEAGLVGAPSRIWLGVPMRTNAGSIGVLVVQHYHDPRAFTEADLDWLTSIAQPIARVVERVRAEDQQHHLREELERAERMRSLGVLAGGVAHDLNNMLGPLVGYPELILMRLPEDSPVRKQVQRIGSAAKQAASVVQDLLTLARRGRYEMVPTDLNAVIDTYLDTPGFAKLTETRANVAVTTALDRNIGTILGSTPHLSKVVMNLVVNAFDAMPDGGRLVISTRQEHLTRLPSGFDKIAAGDYASVSVEDTGTGIDPADIEKIFEPYYSKKTMGTSGSGLGLSVVYGVVKDHKGYYDVTSAVGKGTTFTLYFPITAVPAVDNRPQAAEDLRGNETVLVVDDDPTQREMAVELLTSFGYRVSTACHGHEALKVLSEQGFDILLLDMIMEPDFDGLDTFREVLKIRPGQRTVIISGFSPTERVEEMHKLGAGRYVRKPFTRQTLASAIRAELSGATEPATA